MTTVLKCATMLLSILVCGELAAFGILTFANQGIAVADEKPVLAVSDIIVLPENVFDLAIEKAIKSGEVAEAEEAEAVYEDDWSSDYEDDWSSDYEDDWVAYEYYDGGNDAELIPYDGSGRYNANLNGAWHSSGDFQFSGGDCYDDGSGYSFTWYSENVLPGGGLDIPGRHVGDEGYVCDGDGNIVIASDNLPYGTVVDVPFGNGTGVVYDSGSGHGNLDVYTSW